MRTFFTAFTTSVLVVAFASASFAAQNVVVIFDDSGSMGERMRSQRETTRMDAAKQALIRVLEQLPDEAHVGVATLNHRQAGNDPWLVPLGPVDIAAARESINGMRAEGGTPLGAFLKLGADSLLRKRAAEHYGSFRLLVVTDGEANDGDLLEAYLPDVLSRGIMVDVIGVDMSSDHSLATKVHSYRRADDAESLTTAIKEVFAETSGGQSGDDSGDFELLQALPDEVAAAALVALSESGNEPIGRVEQSSSSDGRSSSNQSRSSGNRNKREGSRFSWLVMFVAIYVLVSVVRSVLRNRR